jgi:hypothetical protein
MFGTRGILLNGSASYGNQTMVREVRTDNPYPLTYPAVTGVVNWSSGAAVSLNDIVIVASILIWQVTTAGNLDTTNTTLTALPSSDPALARSTAATNGTAQLKYVGRADSTWLKLDTYGGDLEVRNCALLNGGRGFHMADSVGGGNRSSIVRISEMVTDHSLDQGVLLDAGFDIGVQGWFSSSLRSRAIEVASTFGYDWSVHDSRLFGCALDGMSVSAGNGTIVGSRIGYNSQLSSGTYHGVAVGANVSHLTINGNRSGQINGTGTNPQGYGLLINGSGTASYYSVLGNWFRGNQQAAGFSEPSGTGAMVDLNVV